MATVAPPAVGILRLKVSVLLGKTMAVYVSSALNEDTSALFKFVPISYEKNTSFQNLLLFLLEELSEAEYAKYNDSLYKKIKTKTI